MSDETPTLFTVGTRGSELALVQATATEAALAAAFPDLHIERRIIKTTGDRRTDVSLADVAKAEGIFDKGVFIKELEQALDDGSIDIAVHSLKDLPTVLDPPLRPGGGAGARTRPRRAGDPRRRRIRIACPPARGWAPAACGARGKSGSCGPISRWWTSAATSRPACRNSHPENTTMRSCWRKPAWCGSAIWRKHRLTMDRSRFSTCRDSSPCAWTRTNFSPPPAKVRSVWKSAPRTTAAWCSRNPSAMRKPGCGSPPSANSCACWTPVATLPSACFPRWPTANFICKPGFSRKPAARRKSGEARGSDPLAVALALFQSLT